MILLHISTTDKQQAEDISDFLLESKFVLDALIYEGQRKLRTETGAICTEVHFMVECRTRALLYDKISMELEKRFADSMLIIYSLPIVNTDWNKSIELVDFGD